MSGTDFSPTTRRGRVIKERPILFKPEMVRAILEGRKTQTRRIIKLKTDETFDEHALKGAIQEKIPLVDPIAGVVGTTSRVVKCPYGVPGDQLWVRETFALESDYGVCVPGYEPPYKDGRPINRVKGDCDWPDYWEQPHYRATDADPDLCYEDQKEEGPCVKWKPSIHMPRWASRITLEVTKVRVERVQDICADEENVIAEGINPSDYCYPQEAFDLYKTLWNSINEKCGYGWDTNPWVWVVEFKWKA